MENLIDDYKRAMRNMLQSVSILTLRRDDTILGVTVSSATSYSAEPPIFMAAIHRESTIAGMVSLGDPMAMNLIACHEQDLARRFSGETGVHGLDRFNEGDWNLTRDRAPVLNTALSSFSGHLRALIPQASHAILLVEIDQIRSNEGRPLGYYNREYCELPEN